MAEILFVIAGLLGSFAFYEAYWTNIDSGRMQAQISDDLDERWQNPRGLSTPELGEAFARMYIPAFGSDFSFAIVEGTSDDDLLAGPGRYTDTQMPGEQGNFAVAGHRVGKGAPFNDLGNLEVCDAVVVETVTTWDVYRVLPSGVTGQARTDAAEQCLTPEQAQRAGTGDYAHVDGLHITTPTDIGVIDALPGTDSYVSEDLEGLITLTTCHPKFSNAERMIVHGMLSESIPKTPGEVPSVFQEV